MIAHCRSASDDPAISVIVPAYNAGSLLEACIDSILGQSFTDFELIVVDDGSTDATPQIVRGYATADRRVRVETQQNSGLSVARNTGLSVARGEYISFVDADDMLHGDALTCLYDAARDNDVEIVVAGHCRFDYDTPERCTPYSPDAVGPSLGPRRAVRAFFCGRIPIRVWGVLYRRHLFDTIRFPAGRIHEDVYVTPRLLARAHRTRCIPQTLYYHRKHPRSITAQLTPDRIDAVRAMLHIGTLARANCDTAVVRAHGTARIISTAGSLAYTAFHASDSSRSWERRIFTVVPRTWFFRACSNPLLPVRIKLLALLLAFGIPVYGPARRLLGQVRKTVRSVTGI